MSLKKKISWGGKQEEEGNYSRIKKTKKNEYNFVKFKNKIKLKKIKIKK